MNVFLISGRRQAGKSTFFQYIKDVLVKEPKEIAYAAEPIKDKLCMEILGCTREQVYGTNLEKDTESSVEWRDAGPWYRWAIHSMAPQSLQVSCETNDCSDLEDMLIRRLAVQDGGDNPEVFYRMLYGGGYGFEVSRSFLADPELMTTYCRTLAADGRPSQEVYVFKGDRLRRSMPFTALPGDLQWRNVRVTLPKDHPRAAGRMTARKLMQYSGNILRNFFGKDVLVRPAMKKISHEEDKETIFLLTDARALHELFIEKALTPDNVRFTRIRLLRAPYMDEDLDTTETSLDVVPDEEFDFVVDNRDITMEEYRIVVAKIVEASLGRQYLNEAGRQLADRFQQQGFGYRSDLPGQALLRGRAMQISTESSRRTAELNHGVRQHVGANKDIGREERS